MGGGGGVFLASIALLVISSGCILVGCEEGASADGCEKSSSDWRGVEVEFHYVTPNLRESPW